MESKNGLNRQTSALWRSFRNGDFEEEDVWEVLKEKTPSHSNKFSDSLYASPSSVSGHHHLPSAAKTIPRLGGSGGGGDDYSSKTTYGTKNAQQSAPLPIPQWFKAICENPRKESNNDSSNDDNDDDDDDEDDDDGDEDDEYVNKVPPHQLIAKRMAKTQISSFSVFEGVGRTLKGRDLSKVRNAVLTKTGFLESL